MSDKSLCLTPDEAESLLAKGKKVHWCLIHETGMQFGCDYDRADAIAALRKAEKITIGRDECLPSGHSVVVWKDGRPSFFASEKAMVKAFKSARAAINQ
jgi:hypothetical protein